MDQAWTQHPHDVYMWADQGQDELASTSSNGVNGGFGMMFGQPTEAAAAGLSTMPVEQSHLEGGLYGTSTSMALGTQLYDEPYSSYNVPEGQDGLFYAGPVGSGQSGLSERVPADSPAALKRGMACTFCRRRKLKCSGEKPRCSSCVRYTQDCEYVVPPKTTKTQDGNNAAATDNNGLRTAQMTPPLSGPGRSDHSSPDTPGHRNISQLPLPRNSTTHVSQGHQNPPPLLSYAPTTALPGATPQERGGYAGGSAMVPEPGWPIYHGQTPHTDSDHYLDFSHHHQNGHNSHPGANSGAPMSSHNAPFNMTISDGFSPYGGSNQSVAAVAYGVPVSTHSVLDPNGDSDRAQYNAGPSTNPIPEAYHPADHPTHLQHRFDNAHTPPYPSVHSTPIMNRMPGPAYGPPQPPAKPSQPSPAELTNAQQKASAAQFFKSARQGSVPRSSSSVTSTPESSHIGPPLHQTVKPGTAAQYGGPLPKPGMMNGLPVPSVMTTASTIDPVDGLTERLGEFLFNPVAVEASGSGAKTSQRNDEGTKKKRRGLSERSSPMKSSNGGDLIRVESDGLTDSVRETLLDCFLAHSRLFFEMSIPRFRYRMTFRDRRRPAPALLFAMYLWATRMSNSPNASPLEQNFFESSTRALDISTANADRLIDCMRAAMLLSAYSYTSGRYHEGWILGGMAIRLILSTGLHQIRSCVFSPTPPKDHFLRGQTFLLPPPEDATDLAERISTFWGIISIERCGSLATGFPSGIVDADVTTPFPPPFNEIVAQNVTQQGDLTIRDLYRSSYFPAEDETALSKWLKATMILERASKLAFVDPEEDSEYGRAWAKYFLLAPANPQLATPPAWLDQPKYRCPKDYAETKLALDQLKSNLGVEGIFPVDRRRNAEIDGAEEPQVTPHIIAIHHQFAATRMFLHDINAPNVENKEALAGARESVALFRYMPPVHYNDVDIFCITVWSVIAKVLCKELRRLAISKDTEGIKIVSDEVDCFIKAMEEVGTVASLARSQANALIDVKKEAMKTPEEVQPEPAEEYRRRVPNHDIPENSETWHR